MLDQYSRFIIPFVNALLLCSYCYDFMTGFHLAIWLVFAVHLIFFFFFFFGGGGGLAFGAFGKTQNYDFFMIIISLMLLYYSYSLLTDK